MVFTSIILLKVSIEGRQILNISLSIHTKYSLSCRIFSDVSRVAGYRMGTDRVWLTEVLHPGIRGGATMHWVSPDLLSDSINDVWRINLTTYCRPARADVQKNARMSGSYVRTFTILKKWALSQDPRRTTTIMSSINTVVHKPGSGTTRKCALFKMSMQLRSCY